MTIRNGKGQFASARLSEMDPIAMHQLCNSVANYVVNATSISRRALGRESQDPRRDIDNECGYPKEIGADDYRTLYNRFGIARRVVDVWPDECWLVDPEVYESEDSNETSFEKAWGQLDEYLRGNISGEKRSSWYDDEEGSPLWDLLARLDRVSGIGSFGGLLIGLDEMPEDLSLELPFRPSETATRRLIYARPLDESMCVPVEWERKITSPRFGYPTMYLVTMSDPEEQRVGSGALTTKNVHWTRIVHVPSDARGSSDLFGPPRMRSNYNRLLDLRKLYGGSGEMYWKGAFPGFVFSTPPQLGGQVSVDMDAFRAQAEPWQNGLERILVTKALQAQSLSPQVVDPTPQIDAEIQAICIDLTVPQRIFMGSERGELSSGQDARLWNGRVGGRQRRRCTPQVIVPVADRLIQVGVLPVPPKGYRSKWPDMNSLTSQEMAEIAAKRTDAMAKYLQGGVDNLIDPMDYLVWELGYTEDEATTILDNAVAHIEEEQAKQAEQAAAQAPTIPTTPPPDQQQGNVPLGQQATDPTGAQAVPFDQTGNAFCPTGEGGGIDPTCGGGGKGSGGGGGSVGSKKEIAESHALALEKVANAPVPSDAAVKKAQKELELARAGQGRAGGESRGGSAKDRRRQRENLFNEFGGEEKGYVVCPWTGIKMHWTDDRKLNPHGFPKFERGKIFVKAQGGGYQLKNLIPESFSANRTRGDTPLRAR